MSEPNSASDPNAAPAVPPVPPAPAAPESAAPPVPPAPAAPTYSYGEAAPAAPPAPPAYGAPGYAAPAYGAPVPSGRKTWDVVLTIILLVLGLIGMIIGVAYGVIFLNPELLGQALGESGYGTPTIDSRGPGTVIVISHVALYLVALGVSILLLVKRKVAFWVPLVAGVIATFVFWFVAAQVFISIPGFAGY